jgi:hypothetical protein
MNDSHSDPPIACQLIALDTTERQRQKELLEIVRRKIRRVLELDDGFELELPSEPPSFMELAEWVSLERRCCAFARFAILADGDENVRVRLSGGPGARDVLIAEMGITPRG